VLFLRGPQTVGELRLRTERMVEFAGLDEIEHELRYMNSRDQPLVTNIGRRPGQKEERWECSLVQAEAGEAISAPADTARISGKLEAETPVESGVGRYETADPLEEMRGELMSLRAEFGQLRRDLDALRRSLGE
jgi:uncharacterized protein YceH (UPF0502 family)